MAAGGKGGGRRRVGAAAPWDFWCRVGQCLREPTSLPDANVHVNLAVIRKDPLIQHLSAIQQTSYSFIHNINTITTP